MQDASDPREDAGTATSTPVPDAAPQSSGDAEADDAAVCQASPYDNDADGWTIADGDCDDCNSDVNPGAFDVPGNLLDDDCAGGIDDSASCDSGLASDAGAGDFAQALDLCRTATLNDRVWGVLQANLTLSDGAGIPSPAGHAIRQNFGSGLAPLLGSSLVVLSTGDAAVPGDSNHRSPAPSVTIMGRALTYRRTI
jgi:hypothetical protein